MTSSTLKVEAETVERTDKEAARAAPVSLPAGSYDLETLDKGLKDAAKATNDDKRDELVDKVLADANETPRPENSLGVGPGYKRVDVKDEIVGVTESRVVFDPAKREEAEDAQAAYQAPIDPAAKAADQGEK